jgi:anti-anti-sigma factor
MPSRWLPRLRCCLLRSTCPNADRVAGEPFAAIKPGVRVVTVDMTLTTFCDSCGRRAIAQAHDRAQSQGAELRLVTASPGVLRVLALTAWTRWCRFIPSWMMRLLRHPVAALARGSRRRVSVTAVERVHERC